jgi:hypothetical protein
VTGLLVSGTDVNELAATIARLMDSEPLRRSLGEAGRARAVREFGWESAAARVTAIHKRLVTEKNRASTTTNQQRAATQPGAVGAAATHERKAP